jgi:hypothetical protein
MDGQMNLSAAKLWGGALVRLSLPVGWVGEFATTRTQIASLVLSIAMINAWNRLNVATRQVTGPWVEQLVTREPAGKAA